MKLHSVLDTYRHNIVIMALFLGHTVHVNAAEPNKTDLADDIKHSAIDVINGEAFTEYRSQMSHWFINVHHGGSQQLSAHRIPASVPA